VVGGVVSWLDGWLEGLLVGWIDGWRSCLMVFGWLKWFFNGYKG